MRAWQYSMLLKQQEQELQALREELIAVKQAARSEEEARVAAERKSEEAQIQLSVERSNHMKLQKVLNLEKSAHAAAKERLRMLAGGADAVDVSDGSGPRALAPSALPVGGIPNYEAAAALEESQATVGQLRSKLAHSESERERDKHKLQRTVDAAQLKRREWEREKQSLKRQLENHEAEVRKRDKWLDKAKDIIKEYQKRHAPGTPAGSTPAR